MDELPEVAVESEDVVPDDAAVESPEAAADESPDAAVVEEESP